MLLGRCARLGVSRLATFERLLPAHDHAVEPVEDLDAARHRGRGSVQATADRVTTYEALDRACALAGSRREKDAHCAAAGSLLVDALARPEHLHGLNRKKARGHGNICAMK